MRVDNINHIIRNKRNNIVLVYPFGKIELEPGQLIFVEQIRSEGILIPKAEVKFKYKKWLVFQFFHKVLQIGN